MISQFYFLFKLRYFVKQNKYFKKNVTLKLVHKNIIDDILIIDK